MIALDSTQACYEATFRTDFWAKAVARLVYLTHKCGVMAVGRTPMSASAVMKQPHPPQTCGGGHTAASNCLQGDELQWRASRNFMIVGPF